MKSTLKLNIEQEIGVTFLSEIIHIKHDEGLHALKHYLFRPVYWEKVIFTKNKKRIIHEPEEPLKKIQRLILEFIFSEIPVSIFAHAGVFEHSVITNAQQHILKKSFFKIDFKDTFPSVTPKLVYTSLLKQFGKYEAYFKKYPSYFPGRLEWLASVITRLTTYRGFLPQGAPTSLSILNLILFDLDLALGKIAEERQLVYTRYSDDLWFSSWEKEISKETRVEIINTIKKLVPFKLNRKKVRYKTGSATVPRITGLNLVWNCKLSLPPYVVDKYRGLIYRAAHDETIGKEKVFGIMGWVTMAYQGEVPRRIKTAFEKFLKLRCLKP